MNDHQDHKIEVKPSSLVNLVTDVARGRYRIGGLSYAGGV